jgi:hypothetical protein
LLSKAFSVYLIFFNQFSGDKIKIAQNLHKWIALIKLRFKKPTALSTLDGADSVSEKLMISHFIIWACEY